MKIYVIKPVIFIIILLNFTPVVIKNAEATNPGQLTWFVFKELVIDTGIDAIQNLIFKDKVTYHDVATLEQRISQLDTQLVSYQNQGNYPSYEEFNKVKQVLNDLHDITNSLAKRLSSVEGRVTALEQETMLLRQAICNLSKNAKSPKQLYSEQNSKLYSEQNSTYAIQLLTTSSKKKS